MTSDTDGNKLAEEASNTRSCAPAQLRAMTDCLALSLPLTPITLQTKGDPCRTRRQTRPSKTEDPPPMHAGVGATLFTMRLIHVYCLQDCSGNGGLIKRALLHLYHLSLLSLACKSLAQRLPDLYLSTRGRPYGVARQDLTHDTTTQWT